MKKKILLLILALMPSLTFAAGPFIWGGDNRAQGLQSSGLFFKNWQTVDSDGERNYIHNNNGLDTSGWTDVGTGTTVSSDSTAANIPLSPYVDRALKIANDGSSTGYTYYQFQLAPNDAQRLLKLCWEQKPGSSYVSSDYKVEVWGDDNSGFSSPTEIALSTDSAGDSFIPALTGQYCTTYASTSADIYIQARIVRVAGSSGANSFIDFNNWVSGPGVPLQGSFIGPWLSYTPTGSWSTNTTYTGKYRRVGSQMEISVKVATAGAPTSAALTVNIPTGFTIDTSALTDTGAGAGSLLSSSEGIDSGTSYKLLVKYSSTTAVAVAYQSNASGAESNVTQAAPFTFGSGDYVDLKVTAPIAEWSGSGALNVSQNAIDYASNSSTSDADDTTSFAYGAAGSQFPSVSVLRSKRARFTTPISPFDSIVIQMSQDSGVTWFEIGYSTLVTIYLRQNNTSYGMAINPINSTDVDVQFYPSKDTTGATFSSTGNNWSSISASATYKWRLVKSIAGQAVGFSQVSQNGSGLVRSAGQLLGTNTNDNAVTGYVGEYMSGAPGSPISVGSTGSVTNVTSITLTPGDWDVDGTLAINTGSGSLTSITWGLSTANNNLTTKSSGGIAIINGVGTTSDFYGPTGSRRFTVATGTTTTVYLNASLVHVLTGAQYKTDSLIQGRRVR